MLMLLLMSWQIPRFRHQRTGTKLKICAMALVLGGCDPAQSRQDVSGEIAALANTITLNVPAKSARWEIFGTPEYKGGTPGPTDFVTLVAELEGLPNEWTYEGAGAAAAAYFVPEAARTWLSSPSRSLLDENRNAIFDMAAHPNCRPYQTTLTSSPP